MTVKLELNPEIEAGLLAQAQARGLSLEAYLNQMIQDQSPASDGPVLSAEEWEREFDAWVESFPDTPLIPDEALTRESMYPDRW